MKRNKTLLFSILFWLLSVSFLVIVVFFIKAGIDDKASAADSTDLNVTWRLTNNNVEIDPDDHSYYSVTATDNAISIYHEAEFTAENTRLALKAFFADVQVFLNDKPVYSSKDGSDIQESNFFPIGAPSPKIHFIDFESVSKGDVIRVDVQLYYNDGTDGISGVMYGTADKVSDVLGKSEVIGIILCTVLFAFGVLILTMRLSSRSNALTSGLEYIAFFSFFGAALSMLHSRLISSEIGLSGNVAYILYCMTFMIMYLPLILFFAENMTLRLSKAILYIDSIFQILFAGAGAAFASNGIVDIHITHFYAEIIGIVQFLIILIALILEFAKKAERWNSDLKLLIIYGVFSFVVVIGQLLALNGDVPVVWLIACIFLVIAVTVIRVRSASEHLKSATETEKIGKLAFEDGLTGVGNTAAFRRKLSHLEIVKINYKTIGIIQFDINNLKTINDTLGHEMGDKLITDGSSMISRIFGKIGDVYRTGGDEFVAIVCGDKALELCSKAIIEFETAMDEYNSDPTHKFKLQVAYGVEYYSSDTDKRFTSLRHIQKLADEKMYNKKREMKAIAQYDSEKVRNEII
ncbi:MAG: GGDEF domain-containing protein [Oscillospiraceae bacterium]|nr:GGDEF domain-containing protein [Oscillospiraceae bacterium]